MSHESKETGFRPDIEGFRALAIWGVVLYHCKIPFWDGGFVGVDIFFVLSGYLITGLILKELQATGTVSLSRFWARRIRRLLPAATLTLVATAIFGALFLTPLRRGDAALDIVASSLYAGNLHFAAQATDYLAGENEPSPVLHFWSLGVEEQFYLCWPLLLLVAARRSKGGGKAARPGIARALAGIWVVSFVLCLFLTEYRQPWAFFGSPPRFWQLGTGAAVCILERRWTALTPLFRQTMSLAGSLLVLASLTFMKQLLEMGFTYPGWIALIPTLGTAAMVLAASGASDLPLANRIFALPLPRFFGRLSYSWYLWHWPCLIVAEELWAPLDLHKRAALMAFSLGLAWITYLLVEQPVRQNTFLAARVKVTFVVGVGLTALGLAGAGLLNQFDARVVEQRALAQGLLHYRPTASEARDDKPRIYKEKCSLNFFQELQPECLYGEQNASRRIVLWGDSHAGNMFEGLYLAATQQGFQLQIWMKSMCSVSNVTSYNYRYQQLYPGCDRWREARLRDIQQRPPAAVVLLSNEMESPHLADPVTGAPLQGEPARDAWRNGLIELLQQLVATGTTVFVVRDNQGFNGNAPSCMSRHMLSPEQCDFPQQFGDDVPFLDVEAAKAVPGVHLVDVTDLYCDHGVCRVVKNGVTVYRDSTHFTATFARTLAEPLVERLVALIPP